MKKTAKKVARRPVAKKSASRKAVARPASNKKPISGVVKLLEVVRATPTRKRQKAA